MQQVKMTGEEIVRRGEEIYERDIRGKVEKEHFGKYLVLDVDTGEYEIDSDTVPAFDLAIAKNPDGSRYLIRIGFKAAAFIGGRIETQHDMISRGVIIHV